MEISENYAIILLLAFILGAILTLHLKPPKMLLLLLAFGFLFDLAPVQAQGTEVHITPDDWAELLQALDDIRTAPAMSSVSRSVYFSAVNRTVLLEHLQQILEADFTRIVESIEALDLLLSDFTEIYPFGDTNLQAIVSYWGETADTNAHYRFLGIQNDILNLGTLLNTQLWNMHYDQISFYGDVLPLIFDFAEWLDPESDHSGIGVEVRNWDQLETILTNISLAVHGTVVVDNQLDLTATEQYLLDLSNELQFGWEADPEIEYVPATNVFDSGIDTPEDFFDMVESYEIPTNMIHVVQTNASFMPLSILYDPMDKIDWLVIVQRSVLPDWFPGEDDIYVAWSELFNETTISLVRGFLSALFVFQTFVMMVVKVTGGGE